MWQYHGRAGHAGGAWWRCWGGRSLPVGAWIAAHVSPDFPWGTFVINISGSFLIGVVLGLATEGLLSTEARLLLAVGVLGGYTTFSTFSYETLELLADGNMRAFLVTCSPALTGGASQATLAQAGHVGA
jgi:fluoride exporter